MLVNYSWCPEWAGLSGNFILVVHPAHSNPQCETVDSLMAAATAPGR